MNRGDKRYMQTALALAEKGIGSVEPNPAVGCVIVKAGRIIGQGWHEIFGGPHAEVNAIADCCARGNNPAGATMYVTLEPCCHTGKTPACTDAIIAAGISTVIAAATDATEKIAGRGFEILRSAGIRVATGLCQEQSLLLNAAFFKYARTKTPWVIAKWAQSADGFLGRTDGKRWITSSPSRCDVQRLRSRVQAILVGINTVIADDPLLTVRLPRSRPLLRVVLDGNLRIALKCRLLQTISQSPVLIIVSGETLVTKREKADAIRSLGAEIFAVKADDGRCDLSEIAELLGKRGAEQLLVEGGREVLDSFISSGLVDEAIIYISSEKLGDTGSVKNSESMQRLLDTVQSCGVSSAFGEDTHVRYVCAPVQ